MRLRHTLRVMLHAPVAFLAACATYAPPPPAPQVNFSEDLRGSYDRTWSAVTYVAGASAFKIKAFEKASGLMTLDLDLKDVTSNVDCGTQTNNSSHAVTPAIMTLGFQTLVLNGSANINIRSEGGNRTALQFNSSYTLVGLQPNQFGALVPVAKWQFNSGSSDTQMIFGTPVTCRPSYKIESSFLREVQARL